MVNARPRHPDLMTADEPLRLIGHECDSCGRVAFPPDPYGCERCGAPAEALQRRELDAVGTIRAVAVVHRHHRPFPATPFTVAWVVLDDGIALKAVLVGDPEQERSDPPAVGAAVRGVAVAVDSTEDGADLLDFRFEPIEPEVDPIDPEVEQVEPDGIGDDR